MTARISMFLKSCASLTCFRACFFLVWLRTYQQLSNIMFVSLNPTHFTPKCRQHLLSRRRNKVIAVLYVVTSRETIIRPNIHREILWTLYKLETASRVATVAYFTVGLLSRHSPLKCRQLVTDFCISDPAYNRASTACMRQIVFAKRGLSI